jgi:Protein of unknown function (DUF3606)
MLGGTSEFRDDFILLRTGQLPLQSYALTEIGAGAQRPSCSRKDEARRIAENIARRADLLGRAAPACQAERIPRDPVSSNSQAAKMISKAITPDRSKIIIEREDHVKYWTRHFSVTKDELARAIERVANSAAAVRKQLSAARAP